MIYYTPVESYKDHLEVIEDAERLLVPTEGYVLVEFLNGFKYPKLFLSAGITPLGYYSLYKTKWEYEFWNRKPLSKKNQSRLLAVKKWILCTKEYAIKQSQLTGSSELLIFRWPELLYTYSKRPITDMSLFCSVKQNLLPLPQWKYRLPVTRYANNIHSGTYYGENTSLYLGTFYYLEPESTTYLHYNTILHSFNKFSALWYLIQKLEHRSELEGYIKKARRLLSQITENCPNLIRYMRGEYRSNLLYTPLEFYAKSSIPIPNKYKYVGTILGLYGMEDILDQILSKLASYVGIDIILCKNMPGAYQVVTEILDIRPRVISFQSLQSY